MGGGGGGGGGKGKRSFTKLYWDELGQVMGRSGAKTVLN